MGDLKTFFDKAVYPDTSDISGDLATERGTDPNASGNPGPGAIRDFWQGEGAYPLGSQGNVKPEDPNPGIAESRNSVSGLPPLPNRFSPATEAPEMPSLQDRIPGTIDKR